MGYKQTAEHIAKRIAANPQMQKGHSKHADTRAKISAALVGQRSSPRTEFKKGLVPWNSGTRCYVTKNCARCGVEFRRYDKRSGTFSYCSQACAYDARRGDQHPGWKGGRSILPSGYIRINIGAGAWQYEHVLVAEKALGRGLRAGECVHHLNGIKGDNRNSNLLICTNGYHRSLERRMARLYQREHFS